MCDNTVCYCTAVMMQLWISHTEQCIVQFVVRRTRRSPSDKIKFQFVESSGIAGMLFIKKVLLSNHLAELMELMHCRKAMQKESIAQQFLGRTDGNGGIAGKLCIKKVLLSNCLAELMELHQVHSLILL